MKVLGNLARWLIRCTVTAIVVLIIVEATIICVWMYQGQGTIQLHDGLPVFAYYPTAVIDYDVPIINIQEGVYEIPMKDLPRYPERPIFLVILILPYSLGVIAIAYTTKKTEKANNVCGALI